MQASPDLTLLAMAAYQAILKDAERDQDPKPAETQPKPDMLPEYRHITF